MHALHQHRTASEVYNEVKALFSQNNCQFSMVHAHFAVLKGFTLSGERDDDAGELAHMKRAGSISVNRAWRSLTKESFPPPKLSSTVFSRSVRMNLFDFSKFPSENELADQSKSDALVKSFALLQLMTLVV